MSLDSKTTTETQKGFDRERALNNPAFLRFLAKTEAGKGGNFDMEDGDELKRWHESFENQAPVAKELIRVWNERIYADTKERLTSPQRKALEEYVAERAAENPDEITGLKAELDDLTHLPRKIEERKKIILEKLKNLRGVVDVSKPLDAVAREAKAKAVELEEKTTLLQIARGRMWHIPFIKREGEEDRRAQADAAEAELKEKYGIGRRDIKAHLERTEAQIRDLSTVAQLEEATAEHSDRIAVIQGDLMSRIEPLQKIQEEIGEKVQRKIERLITTEKPKDLQMAYEEITRYRELREQEGRDYVAKIATEQDLTELDEKMEERVVAEIAGIVRGKGLGFRPLDDLKKALNPFITTERLGSRSKEECRELLLHTLRENLDKLEGDDTIARALLMKGLIISLQE